MLLVVLLERKKQGDANNEWLVTKLTCWSLNTDCCFYLFLDNGGRIIYVRLTVKIRFKPYIFMFMPAYWCKSILANSGLLNITKFLLTEGNLKIHEKSHWMCLHSVANDTAIIYNPAVDLRQYQISIFLLLLWHSSSHIHKLSVLWWQMDFSFSCWG